MNTDLFTESEHHAVVRALETLTPRRVRRALARFSEECKFVEPAKRTRFLKHVGHDVEHRGLSLTQVQLINVAAATAWEDFREYLNTWVTGEEAK